ncbi:MAG: DoxX family protein [bacterium]|nr:DoxX family protein [bacterium]
MDILRKNALWLLRINLAAVFLYHGITKLPAAAGMASMMKVPLIIIYILALAEILAGVFIIAGGVKKEWALLSRISGATIAVIMIGAIKAHWGQWVFMATKSHPMGGIEFQVTLCLTGLYFLLKSDS